MTSPDIPKLDSLSAIFAWALKSLVEASNGGPLTRVLLSIILFGLAIFIAMKAIGAVLDRVIKIGSALKDLGIHTRISPGAREEIRRRRQFCRVLDSDLATLAKAENWNDQYLAELEAEVEAEGSYYLSRLHKLARWKSRGIRRVSSLIGAIENSTENRILVMGEPGSGKSVALRHLAVAYARKGYASGAPETVVPLYINLRELAGYEEPLSPTVIRQFVLDNVRRGDSDTVAYIKEKWDDFKARGLWLFLFDSFDEIPAVLHAPSEGEAIHLHAEAIRHFLDGFPECRAVLASREFKGPRSLPWHRFRILQLSDKRQEELIDCSFVPVDKREAVKRHVATSDGVTFRNPMLLSLLCRFFREHGFPPKTDFDLLAEHVAYLAARDPGFLSARFQLKPTEALDGAGVLAKIIAETPSLGLAPSVAELVQAYQIELQNESPERLIAALVELKIGRVDVPAASPGERRFAFSHRRYQEILYVTYLKKHGVSRRPREFLTNPRLREYTVTFLQSQPLEDIQPLIADAASFLSRAADRQTPSACDEPLAALRYYDWQQNSVEHVLGILKEGFARRLADVTEELQSELSRLMSSRWKHGDVLDILYSVTFSGLLSQEVATSVLTAALKLRISSLDEAVTQAIAYRGSVPPFLLRRFLLELSNATLVASTNVELLRLDAMAARLPAASGANIVFRRSKWLRRATLLPKRFFVILTWPLRVMSPWQAQRLEVASLTTASVPAFAAMSMLLLSKGSIVPHWSFGLSLQEPLVMLLFAALSGAGFVLTVQLSYRTQPEPLRFGTIWRSIKRLPRLVVEEIDWGTLGILLLVLAAVAIVPGAIVHLVALMFGISGVSLTWYAISAVASVSVLGVMGLVTSIWRRTRSIQKIGFLLNQRSREFSARPLTIPLCASNGSELYVWLTTQPLKLLASTSARRSMLRLLRRRWSIRMLGKGTELPMVQSVYSREDIGAQRACAEILVKRLREVSAIV